MVAFLLWRRESPKFGDAIYGDTDLNMSSNTRSGRAMEPAVGLQDYGCLWALHQTIHKVYRSNRRSLMPTQNRARFFTFHCGSD